MIRFAILLTLCAVFAARGADDPPVPPPDPATPGPPLAPGETPPPAKKLEAPPGKWVSISDKLVAAIEKTNGKPTKWPGQAGGIACDRTTGDVYLVVTDNGVWRSSDQGATYVRIDKGNVSGRAETGFSLDVNPAGKDVLCFMATGSSAVIFDNGFKVVKSPASNMDYGAIDWTDGKTLFAVRHETKSWGWMSFDGAETWKDCGPGFDCIGIFDDSTLVVAKTKDPGIQRSEDRGATWEKVSTIVPSGRVMRVFKGVGYWTSASGLLVSKDKGQKWAIQGAPVEMSTGPYFGKDEKNMVVSGHEGLFRTTDGGEHWKLIAPYPEKFKYDKRGWFGNFAWDPVNDILYASVMGQPAYRFEPKKEGEGGGGGDEPKKTEAIQK